MAGFASDSISQLEFGYALAGRDIVGMSVEALLGGRSIGQSKLRCDRLGKLLVEYRVRCRVPVVLQPDRILVERHIAASLRCLLAVADAVSTTPDTEMSRRIAGG